MRDSLCKMMNASHLLYNPAVILQWKSGRAIMQPRKKKRRTMAERDLLMIPGPITFDPAVLRAQARPALGHTTPEFVEIFGRGLDGLREVFLSPSGQPVVVAGSGTLAMDMALCNLIEPGDRVLVVDHGYFGARMADIA